MIESMGPSAEDASRLRNPPPELVRGEAFCTNADSETFSPRNPEGMATELEEGLTSGVYGLGISALAQMNFHAGRARARYSRILVLFGGTSIRIYQLQDTSLIPRFQNQPTPQGTTPPFLNHESINLHHTYSSSSNCRRVLRPDDDVRGLLLFGRRSGRHPRSC